MQNTSAMWTYGSKLENYQIAAPEPGAATVGDIQAIYRLYRPAYRTSSIVNSSGRGISDLDVMNNATEVQRRTRYSFANRGLLVQALSHQSSSIDGSNQRLELLEDAVLEFVVALHYYRKYLETPANDFGNFKSSILSNDALGSLFASLGLDVFINTGLADNIDNDIKWKEDVKRVVYLRNSGITDWKDLNLSKVLGDAMEALVGTTFVDSGLTLGPV
ncbi:Dicer-2, isoform A [Entomortierella chlamydospora]|uniref:Dicer-2, isoform A n=1 Tax=Entomortierella chlamydospora TaxID=101097 RepID=A0A9P6MZT2_9FUNG|nr:Dicer-2, isoform A [Entomortierella chlamydospora]